MPTAALQLSQILACHFGLSTTNIQIETATRRLPKEELNVEDSITQIFNCQKEDRFDKVLHSQTKTQIRAICRPDHQNRFDKVLDCQTKTQIRAICRPDRQDSIEAVCQSKESNRQSSR